MTTYGDHLTTCDLRRGYNECTCGLRSAGLPPDKTKSSGDGRKLRLRSLRDVKIVPTRYLWTDYLPVAELAMLVGKPGVGKSTVAADVAAKLTTGQLGGSFLGRPQNILYSLTEDSEGVFKGRFLAAGGDPERLPLSTSYTASPTAARSWSTPTLTSSGPPSPSSVLRWSSSTR